MNKNQPTVIMNRFLNILESPRWQEETLMRKE